jgi:vibriolysin
MTQRRTWKAWARGALLVAAVAGCQSSPTDDFKDRPPGNQDITSALAQLPEAQVLQYSADGVPQFIVGELGRIAPAPAQDARLTTGDAALRAALPPILKAFRLTNEDLLLRKVTVDEVGGRHYRYTQRFNGLDVVGGDLVIHVDVKDAITGANGTARGDFAPTLGVVAVAESAVNASIASDARWAGLAGRAISHSRMVYIHTQAGTLHKAYEQIVIGQRDQDPVHDKVYVDADTGGILEVHPQIHFAKARATYSANNGTSLPGALRRSEGQAATTDADVNAAHDFAGDTYDLYRKFWNRDSFNNAGAQIQSTVHYSINYCNAFWNGVQMVYGDGNTAQKCFPLARSEDIVAHELTHAVTSSESKLTYTGESGGLNESLSDIFGAAVEAYILGERTGTLSLDPKVFLIGDKALPPFLRDMGDPAADGASRDIWSPDLGKLAPNYSSGPNNLVFKMLCTCGFHPRGKTSVGVPAIGMEKALRLFYKANTDILTSSSSYAVMRHAMLLAAQQLGYSQEDQEAVACAYAAIGVGSAPASCPSASPDGALVKGVPVTGISDSSVGNFKFWSLDVPAGQTTLAFTISGGTGDADLYVQSGSKPSQTVYQCRPRQSGNGETCTFTPPSAGTYWIGLRATSAYSGLALTGTYSSTVGVCGTDPVLTNGVPVTGISGAAASSRYLCIKAVPAGTTLTFNISGGTGDADLYTQFGARPSTASYSCRPYLSGSNETCTHTITTTNTGDWSVMLRGSTAHAGVTLTATYASAALALPTRALTNGVPVTDLPGATGSMKYWTLDIPDDQSRVTFTISGGTGNADLYMKFGDAPSETSFHCRPALGGNGETCTCPFGLKGKYYVALRGASAYAGVTLTGTYANDSPACLGGTCLMNGVPVSNLSGVKGSELFWQIPNVPSGKTPTVKISGGNGSVGLYTQVGTIPTPTSYLCRRDITGNSGTCTHATATTDTWYVMVYGYTAFSGVTLSASF